MRFDWNKLLCTETLKKKEKMPASLKDYPVDPFEQDYREIVSSAAFRYLQDKAQVYQLEMGNTVRTRLTHSLEVSTIAKQLGSMIIYNNKWNNTEAVNKLTPEQARTVPTVLACAGLIHDMGNPPFGHEGEAAIGAWFTKTLENPDFKFFGTPIKNVLSSLMRTDLCNFEGNAQVLRMLSRCRYPSEEQTANVSFATISALIKYPVASNEMDKSSDDTRVHKYGYFYSERQIANKIREKTGLNLPDQPHARNPLTYLLEAADDIAYIASDIEDAVAKQTVSIHSLISFMEQRIAALPSEGGELHQMRVLTTEGILNNLKRRVKKCTDTSAELVALHEWTGYLKNWLMYVTATSFVTHSEEIMNGTYKGDLLNTSLHKYTARILKEEMHENVYPQLRPVHIASNSIVADFLDRFARAVVYFDTKRPLDPLSVYYTDLIPKWAKSVYFAQKGKDEEENLYLRFRMVIDFLTTMTDTSALELYKKLSAFNY